MKNSLQRTNWFKVLGRDELPEGRVKTVSIQLSDRVEQLCLTHFEGEYGALENACPHQGGPLGEGSIEGCYLRCPWHGWDFDPLTGRPPGGFDDAIRTFPVEVREDEVYVRMEEGGPYVRTASDLMVETMAEWGVTHVFGMVGHSNLGLADAVRRISVEDKMDYIAVRHEGAAAFAASAFGKLTGDPAACLTIAGPGATNLLTGLWDARVDRAPVLALTGQVNQQVFGPGAFQELPLKEAFAAVAEFSHLCLPGTNHAELMNLALKHARIERKVSHVIFPDDVQTLPVESEAPVGSPEGRLAAPEILPPAEALEQGAEMLRHARRPAIVVGHGARTGMDAIVSLAEELKCPVLTTFKGKGLIADSGGPGGGHPLGCGVLGRSGTPIASWFMNESDLLLVFGASFSNHTGITPKKPTIQVDFDRGQLARFHPVDLPLWGELGATAETLLKEVRGRHDSLDHTDEVVERWRIWRAEKESRLKDMSPQGVSSIAVFDAMNRVIPQDAIICVDVGNNTYSFGRYFESSGRQAVLMSGYLGSIGFGYPAALGAWAATQVPDRWEGRFYRRPVVVVTGDGGFGQYAWEVNTAVRHGMNITHVLLNNNELGKISKEQRAGHWEVWQTGLTNPNIAEFVSSCGGLGIQVRGSERIEPALQEALAYEGPATVEIQTASELI